MLPPSAQCRPSGSASLFLGMHLCICNCLVRSMLTCSGYCSAYVFLVSLFSPRSLGAVADRCQYLGKDVEGARASHRGLGSGETTTDLLASPGKLLGSKPLPLPCPAPLPPGSLPALTSLPQPWVRYPFLSRGAPCASRTDMNSSPVCTVCPELVTVPQLTLVKGGQ